MSQSVGWQKVIGNSLFFSARGADDRWRIGQAELTSDRVTDLRLTQLQEAKEFRDYWTPNVIEHERGFVLAFAGIRADSHRNGIFFAESESIDGPWKLISTKFEPQGRWQHFSIDLGPGSFCEEGRIFFFFSNKSLQMDLGKLPPLISPLSVTSFLKSPALYRKGWIPHPDLWKNVIRRIGLLCLVSHENGFEVQVSGPLDLNGRKGSQSESVFCPGYIRLDRNNFLVMATSIYSKGRPHEQAICYVETEVGPLLWKEPMPVTILLRSSDLPKEFADRSAMDTPDPVLSADGSLTLYFSAQPRKTGQWMILKCGLEYDSDDDC
jgi:hypothetical protein